MATDCGDLLADDLTLKPSNSIRIFRSNDSGLEIKCSRFKVIVRERDHIPS